MALRILFILFTTSGTITAIFGTIGMITNKDSFTGEKYEEMAGMIPFLALIASLILFVLALLFFFLWRKFRKV